MKSELPSNPIASINDRSWSILMDAIDKERVVPIIGDEFFYIVDEQTQSHIGVEEYLLRELARKFEVENEPIDFTSIVDTIDIVNFKNRSFAGNKTDLYFEIDAILRTATIHCNPSIINLLSIGKFPLILTTSYIPGLEEALSERFGKLTVKVYNKSNQNDIDVFLSSSQPTLYYLFGRENKINKSYMVTEDDLLEYMHVWHNSDTRPERLSNYMSGKFFLLLGSNYPDWLFRFFWHSIRNFSMSSVSNEMQAVVVRDDSLDNRDLARFLSRIQTQILENCESFLQEFMSRWNARPTSSLPQTPIKEAEELPSPEEIDIFISYASEDRTAAEQVADSLRQLGAHVWFDQRNLIPADMYEQIIEDVILKAKRFVPIISHQTLSPGRRFFRREWAIAIREMDFRYGLPYIAPIVIDDCDINSEHFPKPFRDAHCIRTDSAEYTQQLKQLIRSFR